ncbi:MAG: (Fe-S)-binding protein [Phycisphaerae bacterium]|jgi:Fe-S oxidoreductase
MSASVVIVLIGAIVATGVFGFRCYQRVQHLRLGRRAEPFGQWGQRVRDVLMFFCGQARLFRVKSTGLAHVFIFWGFVLLLPTILQALIEGLFPGVVLPFFATFGPLLFLQDLIVVAVIAGVLFGLYYRMIVRPERYQGSHQFEGNLVLFFILTIMVTLLCHSGIRQNLGEAHVAAGWQPISTAVGYIFRGLAPEAQNVMAAVCWWIHLGVVLVFLTLLPLGKHFHVVTSIFSVLLRNRAPVGRLAPAAGPEGVERIEQFTWRQMLDWYSCSECGRCQDVCPAHNSGAPLSPKLLIMKLRAHLFERGQALRGGGPAAEAVLAQHLTGDVLPDEMLWACTTCHACDRECPLFVEHVQPIVDLRRSLLAQQRGDKMLTGALENLRRYGNSFGKSDKQRAKWTTGLGFKPKDIRKQPAQYLWFVGDYASYSPALTEATQATARVFQAAGLDFGLLFDAERNAGNDLRRAGEEGLFELLAQKNLTALHKCQFERIVTTDPHTYNTLKNEYIWTNGQDRPLGSAFPVVHYSELLDELIRDGRLPVRQRLSAAVTYHDPCYLGRYNGVYDAPRRVLEALGCRVVEMPRNRDRALCCGAGGGRIWMEEGQVKERPAESRVREAAALPGVQVFVVACPKDLTMYRDAVKTAGLEGRMVVKDLIELVAEACEAGAAPAGAPAASVGATLAPQ